MHDAHIQAAFHAAVIAHEAACVECRATSTQHPFAYRRAAAIAARREALALVMRLLAAIT